MTKRVKQILLYLLDLSLNLLVIFILVIVIQRWIIAPFDVSGASMCDTLNFINGECVNDYGEKIIINEAVYSISKPERGDIVVFKVIENNANNSSKGLIPLFKELIGISDDKYFIKRVIGLPGETVEIKDGKVHVTESGKTEDIELPETYLNETNKDNTKAYFSDLTVFKVPEKHYFVLGDNRKSSTDSRSCFQSRIDQSCKDNSELSFVSEKLIRGKAWFVWWPLGNIRTIEKPDYGMSSPSLEEK